MQTNIKHIIYNLVIALAMTLFFSCKNDFKSVSKIGVAAYDPVGVGDSINLKFTDSGKVKANLLSPKVYDYSNRQHSYSEFTEGVTLYIYENNEKNTILSDYAIVNNTTDLIDLRGNVIIVTATNDSLFTEQLYYDKENKWVFNNEPVQFKSKEYVTNGIGFDSDEAFTKIEVLDVTGQFAVLD
ncbi:LPS export ABC transporter periplasmic protein LptC [Aurantibacter sp.]|uniref:LPS export ABC transporter periplasmic protein LptC n=1 Tax=Aurantibacter sp. TaxID=2807103 RepID=UPI0035C8286E